MYDNQILPFPLGAVRSSGELETGVTVGHAFLHDGGEYRVVKFRAAADKGDGTVYYHSGETHFATPNVHSSPASMFAGIVQADSGVAAGQYGWVQSRGRGRIAMNVTGTVNANTVLSISGTTGELHAAATTSGDSYVDPVARALQAKSGSQVKAGEYFIGMP